MELTISQLQWMLWAGIEVLRGMKSHIKEHPEYAESWAESIAYEEERLKQVRKQLHERLYQ